MRKIFVLLIALSFIAVQVDAQVTDDGGKKELLDPKKKKQKPKKQDFIILNFNATNWLNSPSGMSVSPFSRGFDFYLMYDLPLGRSPLSFAAGLGISTENIFMNAFLRDSNGGNDLYFDKIEPIINADNPATKRNWKKYKLATTIIELPIEFRFRASPTKRNTFKWAVGFKVGYVITSWEKYVGPDYRNGNSTDFLNTQVKIKEYELPFVTRFRYGVYTRIGYSRLFATFSYTFANFFEKGHGVDGVTPFSLGLSVTIF